MNRNIKIGDDIRHTRGYGPDKYGKVSMIIDVDDTTHYIFYIDNNDNNVSFANLNNVSLIIKEVRKKKLEQIYEQKY